MSEGKSPNCFESTALCDESNDMQTPLLVKGQDEEDHDGFPFRERLTSINNNVSNTRSTHRLLPRDAPFYQSKGNWNIHLMHRFDDTAVCSTFLQKARFFICLDWFHSLVYSPTPKLLLVLFIIYILVVLFFAVLYFSVPKFLNDFLHRPSSTAAAAACNMDMKNYLEAIYFSTSTMTTIGYGVSDYYFGDCIAPLILILLQIFASLAMNAVAFGLLFLRLSTSRKRRKTLIFSNKAVIRRVKGELYFMVRIAELTTKRHLMQCQAKLYCIRHDRYNTDTAAATPTAAAANIETDFFQLFEMKIQQKYNGGNNNVLFMALPTVLVHKIDASSPLVPPCEWYDSNGILHTWDGSRTNNCNTAESYYQKEKHEISLYLRDRDAEIVLLIEGLDEMTSSPLQAKQSYKLDHDDILWDHAFAPCLYSTPSSDSRQRHHHCMVDFSKFHQVVPVTPSKCYDSNLSG